MASILVTDGAVNAGDDPVAAARALGVPVHGLLVGRAPVRAAASRAWKLRARRASARRRR